MKTEGILEYELTIVYLIVKQNIKFYLIFKSNYCLKITSIALFCKYKS